MPAVIAQAAIDRWLSGGMSAEEMRAAPVSKFREGRVSTRINKSGVFDGDGAGRLRAVSLKRAREREPPPMCNAE
jgi:hypothetical protein